MLEEQIRGIYYKMGEMMGSDEASMDEGNLGCRRETDGEEWQRWNGSWWIRVEQQNLNSRQRRGNLQGSQEDDNPRTKWNGQPSERVTERNQGGG